MLACIRLVVAEVIVIDFCLPEYRPSLTEPAFRQRLAQQIVLFSLKIRCHRLEHRDFVCVGRFGEEIIPEWQRARDLRCCTEQVIAQAVKGGDAVFATRFLVHLILELLVACIELGMFFDWARSIAVFFKCAAVPNGLKNAFDVRGTPHFGFHDVIGDGAVLTLWFGPCANHQGLRMGVTCEVWSHRLCLSHSQRLIKQRNVGSGQRVEGSRNLRHKCPELLHGKEILGDVASACTIHLESEDFLCLLG